MKKEILKIESKFDGLPLSTAVYAPDGEVKGIVQLAHGMSEHKERYFPFMEFLAEAGYASILHDHRAHRDLAFSRSELCFFQCNLHIIHTNTS